MEFFLKWIFLPCVGRSIRLDAPGGDPQVRSKASTHLCVCWSDDLELLDLQLVFLLFVWRGTLPGPDQCNQRPSTESTTSEPGILRLHGIREGLPFCLMRLKQGLQRARCGAIANLHKRAPFLVSDGPYRTDHTRRLQGTMLIGPPIQNSRDILLLLLAALALALARGLVRGLVLRIQGRGIIRSGASGAATSSILRHATGQAGGCPSHGSG